MQARRFLGLLWGLEVDGLGFRGDSHFDRLLLALSVQFLKGTSAGCILVVSGVSAACSFGAHVWMAVCCLQACC